MQNSTKKSMENFTGQILKDNGYELYWNKKKTLYLMDYIQIVWLGTLEWKTLTKELDKNIIGQKCQLISKNSLKHVIFVKEDMESAHKSTCNQY